MAEEILGKFRCILMTPHGRLLDGKTHSITIDAHDGRMGIWRDHMPMLCRLGKGYFEAKDLVSEDDQNPQNLRYQINGGLMRISNNVVTIMAYDANLVEN